MPFYINPSLAINNISFEGISKVVAYTQLHPILPIALIVASVAALIFYKYYSVDSIVVTTINSAVDLTEIEEESSDGELEMLWNSNLPDNLEKKRTAVTKQEFEYQENKLEEEEEDQLEDLEQIYDRVLLPGQGVIPYKGEKRKLEEMLKKPNSPLPIEKESSKDDKEPIKQHLSNDSDDSDYHSLETSSDSSEDEKKRLDAESSDVMVQTAVSSRRKKSIHL